MNSRNPPDGYLEELDDSRQLSFGIENDPTSKVWRRRYAQKRSEYARLAMDTADDIETNCLLVDEQPFAQIDEVIYFERVFAAIPADKEEPLTTSYTFPGALDSRDPITRGTFGRLAIHYILNPTIADFIARQRYVNDFGDVVYLNNGGGVLYPTSPSSAVYFSWVILGTEIVPDDSRFERYMGNIWRRLTPYIKAA